MQGRVLVVKKLRKYFSDAQFNYIFQFVMISLLFFKVTLMQVQNQFTFGYPFQIKSPNKKTAKVPAEIK
jgi:hypothetical protein